MERLWKVSVMKKTMVIREPGTKTLYVEARVVEEPSGCRLVEVKLSGDFFVYPESGLEALEESLKNCSSMNCVVRAVNNVRKHALFIGFPWKGLLEALKSLLEKCQRHSIGTG